MRGANALVRKNTVAPRARLDYGSPGGDPSKKSDRGDATARNDRLGSSPKGGWVLIHQQVEIVNALGLHMRAVDKFVRLSLRYQSDVRVSSGGKRVNGKSILDLMALAAPRGSQLDIEASGPDAEEVLAALSELVKARFHETDDDPDEPISRQLLNTYSGCTP